MKDPLLRIPAEESELLRRTIEITGKAGNRLMESFRKDDPVERGAAKEIKTVYDLVADRIIRNFIEKQFRTDSYVTEETGFVDKGSDYLWIIDPLDGTGNFADQNPMFAVSIALLQRGEPLLAVIEAPMMQERFAAVRNFGAYHYDLLRNKTGKARVSDVSRAGSAYGVYCEGGVRSKKRSLGLLGKYYLQVRDTRKLGSAALELASVGMGRAESYMTTKISLWDIAAGVLFVREAGGDILHFDGTPYEWKEFKQNRRFDLLATNGKVNIKML